MSTSWTSPALSKSLSTTLHILVDSSNFLLAYLHIGCRKLNEPVDSHCFNCCFFISLGHISTGLRNHVLDSPTILHLGEDFSNLSRTEWINWFWINNWLRDYDYLRTHARQIKLFVVHLNELHRAQATKSIVSKTTTMNPISWVIWISLRIASWRTMAFNLSWSSSPIWDPRFFITHFCGFFLVPSTVTKSTFLSIYSASKLAVWSPPSVTSSEISTDNEPYGDEK